MKPTTLLLLAATIMLSSCDVHSKDKSPPTITVDSVVSPVTDSITAVELASRALRAVSASSEFDVISFAPDDSGFSVYLAPRVRGDVEVVGGGGLVRVSMKGQARVVSRGR